MQLLNIGCGNRFHPAWVNIDMIAPSPEVTAYDIRRGLPFPDGHFDGCYSSHLLEHLTPVAARHLLAEAFRVLRPRGIIRVVTPDLEGIVQAYLKALNDARRGAEGASPNYEWMMLELYDQAVRDKSGGEMGRYLARTPFPNKAFVLSRIGFEAEHYWDHLANRRHLSLLTRLRRTPFPHLLRRMRLHLAGLLLRLVSGRDAQAALEEGLFRQSGEIHRWMYDSYSLGRLLEEVGFMEATTVLADESRIPGFVDYQLDTVEGSPRKPDSLFMEAYKP